MDHALFLDSLRAIVGEAGLVCDAEKLSRYTREWRGKFASGAIAAVRPASTAEVSAVVATCTEYGIAITPQGGNTGLVGGSVPIDISGEIVLSLERMNAIEDVDPDGNTMVVQAGCILAQAQQAAEQVELLRRDAVALDLVDASSPAHPRAPATGKPTPTLNSVSRRYLTVTKSPHYVTNPDQSSID